MKKLPTLLTVSLLGLAVSPISFSQSTGTETKTETKTEKKVTTKKKGHKRHHKVKKEETTKVETK
jgi:hypothetical protein